MESSAPRRGRRFAIVLLVVALYAAAIYLPFLGSARVLSQHEGFIATTALRMLSGGDWLIPPYANWNRIEKPPAYNWICAGLFKLVGRMSETAERLPAALSAIGLCVLVAVAARRFYEERTALLAGLIQATCIWSFMQGRLGENDMPLVFLLTLAHAALLWHWGRGEARLPLAAAIVFHSAIGLAAMFKGAAALPFPAMTVLGWCILQRSVRPLVAVLWTPAILCFFAIAAPWHIYVWTQLGQEALDRWFHNAAGRVLGEYEANREPFWFYLARVPWLMLPWTIALAVNMRVLWRDARAPDGRVERFLWTWFFGGLLFVSISAFKHNHYCYPALPPLAILCASLVSRHMVALGLTARRVYGTVFGIALAVYLIVAGVVYPRTDHWGETMRFVRDAGRRVPPGAAFYAVGLGNSAVYPYIPRPYDYLDGMPSLAERLAEQPQRETWILALQRDVDATVAIDPTFTELARAGHPDRELLIVGRATLTRP